MASYQSQHDDQDRKVDEYGNPVHGTTTSVTYVANTGGHGSEAAMQHGTTGVYDPITAKDHHATGGHGAYSGGYSGGVRDRHQTTGDYDLGTGGQRQHFTTGGNTGDYGGDYGNRQHGTTGDYGNKQHGTTGDYGGDFGRHHGTTGGGDDSGGLHYGVTTADTGTGPRSGTMGGTGYGSNTGGAHTDAGYQQHYGKEQYGKEHGHEKKGIVDKIKEKLPGGHSDK